MSERDPIGASRREKIAVLGGLASLAATALFVGLIYAHDETLELLGLIPVAAVAVGKLLPLWAITGRSQFSVWELGVFNGILDSVTAIVMVYGLGVLMGIRLLRKALNNVRENAQLLLDVYPAMHKIAVLSVVLFVAFPITGTGAVGGTFLAILLGLGRREIIGWVSLGGLAGGLMMAYAALRFHGTLLWLNATQSGPFKYAAAAVLASLAVLAFVWLSRRYKSLLATARLRVASRRKPVTEESS